MVEFGSGKENIWSINPLRVLYDKCDIDFDIVVILCIECGNIPYHRAFCEHCNGTLCNECCLPSPKYIYSLESKEQGTASLPILCPICEQIINQQELPRLDTAKSIKAECKYADLGCILVLSYEYIEGHQKNCPYNPTNENNHDVNYIEKQGWLSKQRPGVFKLWQEKKLRYFNTDKQSKEQKGILAFDEVECFVENNGRLIEIRMNGSKRVFRLKAGSVDEAKDWCSEISNHILCSNGAKNALSAQGHGDQFWRVSLIE